MKVHIFKGSMLSINDVFSSMYKLLKKVNGNIEKIACLVQLNDKRDEIEKQINDLIKKYTNKIFFMSL